MALKSDRAIESVPFFPAIAWSIFVLFAVFVYMLAAELKNTTAIIENATYANAGVVESLRNPTAAE